MLNKLLNVIAYLVVAPITLIFIAMIVVTIIKCWIGIVIAIGMFIGMWIVMWSFDRVTNGGLF